LRAAIDDEGPVDGIHNKRVRQLYESDGECPRYLGCTSEGSAGSTHRDNPDFLVGDLKKIAPWLAASYEEGWAANWVCDLDHPEAPGWRAHLDWKVSVQVPRKGRLSLGFPIAALVGRLRGWKAPSS